MADETKRDAQWDVYSFSPHLKLLVITGVAPNPEDPDASCNLEVWQADDQVRARELLWSHDFGAARSEVFRPLVAMERHLAVASAIEAYRGPLPHTQRDLKMLLRQLADPVAEAERVSDLLRATSEAYAYSYIDEWGLVISTVLDGTTAVTSIAPGDMNFQHFGDAIWFAKYDPALAGKEMAALLNAFSATPAPAILDEAIVRQIADDTSITQWLKKFQVEDRPDVSEVPKESVPAPEHRRAWGSPLAAWSIRVVTTMEPDGAASSSVQALGGSDEGRELWHVQHPPTISSPEEAHDDLMAVLVAYEMRHELPVMREDRHRLSTRLLTHWWHGPQVAAVAPAAPAVPQTDAAPTRGAAGSRSPDPAEVGSFPAEPVPPPPPTPGWYYADAGDSRFVLWHEPQFSGDKFRVASVQDRQGWPKIWPSAQDLLASARNRDLIPVPHPLHPAVHKMVEDTVGKTLDPGPDVTASVASHMARPVLR
jgi:hypothetical protein